MKGEMGPGTDVWPHCTSLDNRQCMPAMIEDEDADDLDNLNETKFAKPPRNGPPPVRHSFSEALLVDTSNLKSPKGPLSPQNVSCAFLPAFRSGSCSEIGPKPYMEDEFICVDDLQHHLDAKMEYPLTGAFYGVFDGHGGVDAASFTKRNILEFIIKDANFPNGVQKAVKNAFAKIDHELADHSSLDNSSGTTALTILILGRNMIIANAGDCRAVLGKRGRAIELSVDHKPNCTSEKMRIEKLGGVIYDGYLNGQLSVARALGDWHMKAKGSDCPLSSEPELKEVTLTEEDEFVIIGCDGLWDVMSSQYAVTIVRKELMVHNDPEKCCIELVGEALKRNSCDNLTVVVICFSSEPPPPKIEIPRSRNRRTISVEGLDVLKGVLHHV